MSGPITYRTGDATGPDERPAIIAHVCNDAGGWGRGFVTAISARWPEPEAAYRRWHHDPAIGLHLGTIGVVTVADGLAVANMIAQHAYTRPGAPAIRYDALETCLTKLAQVATTRGASVHMPRIGCGLAGGTWDRVEPLITRTLADTGVAVVVYDLP